MVLKDLKLPETELPGYCRRNGIRRLELFGSAIRADFGPQSDVDLLVEFRPDARIRFLALSRIQRELLCGLDHRSGPPRYAASGIR